MLVWIDLFVESVFNQLLSFLFLFLQLLHQQKSLQLLVSCLDFECSMTNFIVLVMKPKLCSVNSAKQLLMTLYYFIFVLCSVAHLVEEAPHGFAGIAVAVVLIIITVVGLGAFLLRKRIPTPVLGECTFDNSLYFNNPIRAAANVDTKGLVANIEQNEQA